MVINCAGRGCPTLLSWIGKYCCYHIIPFLANRAKQNVFGSRYGDFNGSFTINGVVPSSTKSSWSSTGSSSVQRVFPQFNRELSSETESSSLAPITPFHSIYVERLERGAGPPCPPSAIRGIFEDDNSSSWARRGLIMRSACDSTALLSVRTLARSVAPGGGTGEAGMQGVGKGKRG